MSECERRTKCHANCAPNWWCHIKRIFNPECRVTENGHDLEQSVVAKVLGDDSLAEVSVDQKIRQLGGL